MIQETTAFNTQFIYERWWRFIHETLTDGTVRDVYYKEGGITGETKEIIYKIL